VKAPRRGAGVLVSIITGELLEVNVLCLSNSPHRLSRLACAEESHQLVWYTHTYGMNSPSFPHRQFGAQIKSWHTDLHLTQHELAQQVGVTGGFMAHVETGRTMPAVKTCKKLAHALGVDEMEMLKLAGIVSDRDGDGHKTDEELLDPELRVFFRDVWPRMSEDACLLLKDMLVMMTSRTRQRIDD